jgi:hypothetical protein
MEATALAQGITPPTGDENVRALRGEPLCGSQPYSGGATGDHCRLALEPVHVATSGLVHGEPVQ